MALYKKQQGSKPNASNSNPQGESTAGETTAPETKAQKRRRWTHKDVNEGQQSFASGLNIYKIIWVFLIGSFIGVVFETLYVFFMDRVWMNRAGVLYGPFNQVYGIGAVLFTVALYRFRHKNAIIIFLASAVIGSVFEYACSWAQQLAFGSVSWEYSDMPANIGGRTNLYYAFGWGIMGLIFITHTWPFLSEMIERIPNTFGKTLTIVLAVLFAADLALSGAAVFRQSQRVDGVPATNVVACWLDETYPDEYMAKAYPSMEFVGRFGDRSSKTETDGSSDNAGGQSTTSQPDSSGNDESASQSGS